MKAREKQGDKKTVLIVDDHEIMRQGLAQLIEQEPDLEVCGEAEDPRGALAAVAALHPDIAIVDISLKEGNGIELIKDIRVRWPNLPVLVLSMHSETLYAERVLRAGARGYVTKSEASSRVLEGLRRVISGQVYVSEKVAAKMLNKLVAGGSDFSVFPVERLSDREFEIFGLIGQGLGTRDIAKRLHLSVKTIETHREHIKTKLSLDSATELLTYAVKWVQLDDGS